MTERRRVTLGIAFYRLIRLRRLIVFAAVPPVLVLLVLALVKGQAAFYLLPLAVGLPFLHALRFPTAWIETLSVSITLAIALVVAGTVRAGLGLDELALRLLALGALAAVIFVIISLLLPVVLSRGEEVPVIGRASRRVRLTPDEARARLSLYPGRSDGQVTCGDLQEDGVFDVTLHPLGTPDAAFDLQFYAVILEDAAGTLDIMAVEEETKETTRTRSTFTPARRGTRVDICETGAMMPWGLALGYWLQDHMADSLADEVARAEGRRSRANITAPPETFLSRFSFRRGARRAGGQVET
ncbi:MAG: hypothetical protein AAFU80_04455 [Pseudomonadota bacterium]